MTPNQTRKAIESDFMKCIRNLTDAGTDIENVLRMLAADDERVPGLRRQLERIHIVIAAVVVLRDQKVSG